MTRQVCSEVIATLLSWLSSWFLLPLSLESTTLLPFSWNGLFASGCRFLSWVRICHFCVQWGCYLHLNTHIIVVRTLGEWSGNYPTCLGTWDIISATKKWQLHTTKSLIFVIERYRQFFFDDSHFFVTKVGYCEHSKGCLFLLVDGR